MTNKEFVFGLLRFLRPKFYNKITWILIIGGLGLFSTPIFERIINAFTEKYFDFPISDENASIYGIIIIALALMYNLSVNYLEFRTEKWSKKETPEQKIQKDLDLKLYRKIREILPSDGSISFIRTNNFAGFSFDWKRMEQLDEFIHESNKPEFKFIDKELEKLRTDLTKNIDEFLSILSVNSFYLKNNDRASVPEEWEIDQPDRFWDVVNKLSERQQNSWNYYSELIIKGREKLGE